MNFRVLPICLFAIAMSACVTTKFSKTGDYIAEPRAQGCDFAVYTIPPASGFKEIGSIAYANQDAPTTPDEAKKASADKVCQAGGNGVILENMDKEYGYYHRATVIWTVK